MLRIFHFVFIIEYCEPWLLGKDTHAKCDLINSSHPDRRKRHGFNSQLIKCHKVSETNNRMMMPIAIVTRNGSQDHSRWHELSQLVGKWKGREVSLNLPASDSALSRMLMRPSR